MRHGDTMRVGTWNLNSRRAGRSDNSRMVALISSTDLDVLFLQEVYQADMASFLDLFDDCLCSLEVERSTGQESGKVGVAIMTRREVRLQDGTAKLIDKLPQPERGLTATAAWRGGSLELLSWHAPNARQHGRARKEEAYKAVSATLASWTSYGIAGMDTNFPEDPLDLAAADAADARPEWRFHWELLGADPQHGCHDLLRQLVTRKPDLVEASADGPLAATHIAGQRQVRFDRLLATSRLQATHFTHLLADGVAAGSDHALVIADIESPPV
jgi:exonuclease III